MYRFIVSFSVVLLNGGLLFAQPDLLPSIGIGSLPADDDAICTLPFQTPPITSVGRPAGEMAADFNLYDLDGNGFTLNDALALGKPVLMISASYTCPVFRGKVPVINTVVATYGDQITTIIVYTPEAHPDIDTSPYFGAVNTGAQNTSAGILYRQPTTYGERKAVLQDMLANMQIGASVYLDGPCNEWWNYYGPQPNNAYLINTDGTIYAHHDWFDRSPDDIECDIDNLLGTPTNCAQTFGGTFALEMISNDTVYGQGGTTLYTHARLFNTGNEDAQVMVWKMQESLPAGWSSSLCLDVCYLPDVDTAIVVVPAGGDMHFYYYFYSTPGIAMGYARAGLRNTMIQNNGFSNRYWAFSDGSVGANEVTMAPRSTLAPNPASQRVSIASRVAFNGVVVLDGVGRIVLRSGRSTDLDVSRLASGPYDVVLMLNDRTVERIRMIRE